MDDKSVSSLIRAFIRNPVSVFNAVVVLFFATTWWNTREANLEKIMSAARAQDVKIEKVETRIEAAERADIKQNAEIVNALGAIGNRLSVLETDTRWLVRQQGGPQRP